MVFCVLTDDAVAGELPGFLWTNAHDLARIFSLEVVKGVIASDASHAGDEQRENRET